MVKPNEQALVKKFLRRHDEISFRELYRSHSPALYALALRLCDSNVDAEDALQNVWIRAAGSLSAFQWKSTLRTWLTGILINCVREQRRKRERLAEDQIPDNFPAPAARPAADGITLENAIANLPSGYRQVLVLHDLEGYTHEEIGALMDISPGTSKSQLHHARRAIRGAVLVGAQHHERL